MNRRTLTAALWIAIVLLSLFLLVRTATAHTPARGKCQTILSCRARIVHLERAVQWQRRQDYPGDVAAAIRLACDREGMTARCGEFFAVGSCESHLHALSTNGQFKGVFQLGAMHRADPVVRLLGWDDPYANALHTVRFVKAHGWSQWQCRPSGGLGW